MKIQKFLMSVLVITAASTGRAHSLLTVSGISLGKTRASDLATAEITPQGQVGTANVQGLLFWFVSESQVFYSFQLDASNQFQNWPQEWRKQGLLPEMTYSQVKSFLEGVKFRTIESKVTKQVTQQMTQQATQEMNQEAAQQKQITPEVTTFKRLEGTFLSNDRRALTLKFDFNLQDQLVHVTAFGMPRPAP